ncbi:MAG: Tetratricopeptide 2 repeat protein [Bryobacterales bacterium]|jgi:tetratricopeptide (TPR) repeat protein|nr:Tetratricopeptide 2 repeat protein [Bryobacterales bacterium]
MTAPKGFRSSSYGSGPYGSTPAAARVGDDSLQAALALRSQGRFQEALDLLSGPGEFSADVYTLRGDLLADLGQFTEAAGSYYTATVSAPANLYARRHLASCLRRLGRWQDAVDAFQVVLNADPHRDPIRLELGDCLLRLNRLEEALSCFDQCWSDAAQRHALFGKGVALQLLRRFDEAEIAYERVLSLDGKAEEALANLIAMSMEVFDLERVQRYSRRLVEINPRSVPGLQGLTLVAVERGQMEAAARHFFTLAEQAPESVGPPRDASDDDVIEYRVSRKAIDRLKDYKRAPAAEPAPRRY